MSQRPPPPDNAITRLSARLSDVLAAGERRRAVVCTGAKPDPAANKHMSPLGPQSARPLPRWYTWSLSQQRYRALSKKDPMKPNNALENASKQPGGLQLGPVPGAPHLNVTKWDNDEYKGELYKNGQGPYTFERLTQEQAAEIQVDHLVYDHSGPVSDYLQNMPHVQDAFRAMMRQELDHSRTHVFFYHSFGAVGVIYDIGAALMRVVFPEYAANEDTKHALLPRTDRSRFNNRSVRRMKKHFLKWFGSDGHHDFQAMGMSSVLNALKPDTEATVVEFFKANYSVGTSLDGPLNELLKRFGIEALREPLLQLALEADIDVRPYRSGHNACYTRTNDGEAWEVMEPYWESHAIQMLCTGFLDDDNQLGPFYTTTADGKALMLSRATAGAAALGTLGSKQLRINTPHTGQYLQLAVPHDLVEKLAYPNTLAPFGNPDPTPDRALGKVKDKKTTVDGQARIIARPDLFWADGVKQWRYQFSRHATAKREWYLEEMAKQIQQALTPELTERARAILRPPPIRVLSLNIDWQNKKLPALATQLANTAHEYDIVCLQECTGTFLSNLESMLPASHVPLRAQTCGGSYWAVLVYNRERFDLVGAPWFGCFQLADKTLDKGRPVVSAVLRDRKLGRLMIVGSVHAPHGSSKGNYKLSPNLAYFMKAALHAAGDVPWHTVTHVVFAGDYNRTDWNAKREVYEPVNYPKTAPRVQLYSAQGGVSGTLLTQGYKHPVPFDNVLYGSRVTDAYHSYEAHTLELTRFAIVSDKKTTGSDHQAVTATFAA